MEFYLAEVGGKLRDLELLIPAGNLENLKVAIDYGADAVYIGGEFFSLRAKAKNFTKEDMKAGIEYAHERGKKVYVTANILGHNDDLDAARGYFEELKEIGPDALIISDPGIFTVAKEVWPEVEIHISTQANNTNYATYLFWWKLGATRVVTARELSLEEIKKVAFEYGKSFPEQEVSSLKDAYELLMDILLDGLPCDVSISVTREEENELEFILYNDIHKQYFNEFNLEVSLYHEIREAFVNGIFERYSLKYKNISDSNKLITR